MAGVEPIDFPMTMISAGECFNLDVARSNIANAAWCIPSSIVAVEIQKHFLCRNVVVYI
jgi:hypothetical protein